MNYQLEMNYIGEDNMDFTKIPNLITNDESHELYEYQNDIIYSQSLSDEEKLIRLAIIQTLSPVEDWESASDLLKEHIRNFSTFNLLIGVFISLTAFEFVRYKDIDYFNSLIDDRISELHGDFLSVADFIKARYIIEKGGDTAEAIALLKKSVDTGPRFVMNYVELSNYVEPQFKRQCFQNACSNVQSFYNENSTDMSIHELTEPLKFFNERIVKVDINWHIYQDFIRLSKL